MALTERAGLYFIMIINRITTMTTTPNAPTRTDRNLKSFPIVQAYKLRGGFPSLALAGCAGRARLAIGVGLLTLLCLAGCQEKEADAGDPVLKLL